MSRTGNTEKIAQAIFSATQEKTKILQGLQGKPTMIWEIFILLVWTDRGSASVEVLDYLGSLQGKKIALFGTCGMGESIEYYRKIEERIKVFIEDGNQYLGCFLCQGKMPMQVREKYLKMRCPGNEGQIQKMLQNFDKALLHPDWKDMENAQRFVHRIYSRL